MILAYTDWSYCVRKITIIFQARCFFFFYSLQKVLTFFRGQGKVKYQFALCENSTVENCSSRFILIRNCARYGNLKTGSRCWKCFTIPEIYCAPKNACTLDSDQFIWFRNGGRKKGEKCSATQLSFLTETLVPKQLPVFIIFDFSNFS